MPAKIIDGSALAAEVRQEVAQHARVLADRGRPVKLCAILIGLTPAAEMYAKRQGEGCRQANIGYDLLTLPADSTEQQVTAAIENLNADPAVTGIMLHMPVPQHLDATVLQSAIAPIKDVEGVSPANLGWLMHGRALNAPCTAMAAFELAQSTGVNLRGAEAVVVGASEIVGTPVALMLSEQRATVTICRSATRDLAAHTRRAEVLVVAVGKPQWIGADHIRDGAVVIDVGINRIKLPDGKGKTVGDVDFEAAKERAGHITPVPGGVGPMTVAMLLRNTVRSAEAQAAR